jgi:hypothetical protein
MNITTLNCKGAFPPSHFCYKLADKLAKKSGFTNKCCPICQSCLSARSLFELCRSTQQPSLTFRLVGGSMFGLWPLFHLRDGGKWTEMTATQHGGT